MTLTNNGFYLSLRSNYHTADQSGRAFGINVFLLAEVHAVLYINEARTLTYTYEKMDD